MKACVLLNGVLLFCVFFNKKFSTNVLLLLVDACVTKNLLSWQGQSCLVVMLRMNMRHTLRIKQ